MLTISGNITGSIATVPFNLPCKIISGYFTNRTTGTITMNVYVATGSGNNRAIVPLNLIMISGVMHIISDPLILEAGYYLIIATSGSVDYFISLEPV